MVILKKTKGYVSWQEKNEEENTERKKINNTNDFQILNEEGEKEQILLGTLGLVFPWKL